MSTVLGLLSIATSVLLFLALWFYVKGQMKVAAAPAMTP